MNTETYSTVDLIILGFLMEEPRSAYDLAGVVESRQASRMVKISAPAIYKACKRLHAAGVLSRKVSQTGERPEKAIYSLTAQGKDRFHSLMAHFSSHIKPFYLDFNAFLYHIDKLEKSEGQTMLEKLHRGLTGFNAWLVQHEKEESPHLNFAQKAIVREYRMLFGALLKWSADVQQGYETSGLGRKGKP